MLLSVGKNMMYVRSGFFSPLKRFSFMKQTFLKNKNIFLGSSPPSRQIFTFICTFPSFNQEAGNKKKKGKTKHGYIFFTSCRVFNQMMKILTKVSISRITKILNYHMR